MVHPYFSSNKLSEFCRTRNGICCSNELATLCSNANFQVFLSQYVKYVIKLELICEVTNSLFSVRDGKTYLVKMQIPDCICSFDSKCLFPAQFFNQFEGLCECMTEASLVVNSM